MRWIKQNPGWTMFGALIALLVFLWSLAGLLAEAPAPIGSAAEQFGFDADPAKSFVIHAVCTFDNSTQFEGDVVIEGRVVPATIAEAATTAPADRRRTGWRWPPWRR